MNTDHSRTSARIFETYLTSARVLNSEAGRREKILSDLKRVAGYLSRN